MAVSSLSSHSVTRSDDPNLTKSEKSKVRLDQDLDAFMLMLTTQLKNQDPTSPMDSNEFTQQLVAFSEVEQSINTNKYLEKIVALNEKSEMDSALGFIDKIVELDESSMNLYQGRGEVHFYMGEGATKTSVSVLDKRGEVVYTKVIDDYKPGENKFKWDGHATGGNMLPDGDYQTIIKATDKDGKPVAVAQTSVATVNGITIQNGKVLLVAGDREIPIDKVVSALSQNKDLASN